jgi:molecular chaperone GrpE (heat shock protein)
MPEDKRKLCVWVPEGLYEDVIEAGYDGPTSAVTQGFKLLMLFNKRDLENKLDTYLKSDESKNNPTWGGLFRYLINEDTEDSKLLTENEELKKEVERLTEALQKSPSQVELVELRVKNEGLEKLLEEKDKRIEDLTKAVDILSVFANYFKTLNQNK